MVQLIFQVSDLVHGPRTKSNEKHKIDAGKIAYQIYCLKENFKFWFCHFWILFTDIMFL